MGDTKADTGMQPPDSARCIAEVCQPNNAPTPSEAAQASLSQCFQKALATPRTEPVPPLEQPRGQTKGESPRYSLANPFVGINPPPPEVLKESNPDHSARCRATTLLEWQPEEKK